MSGLKEGLMLAPPDTSDPLDFRKSGIDAEKAAMTTLKHADISVAQRMYVGTLFRSMAQRIVSAQSNPIVSAVTLKNGLRSEDSQIPDELLVLHPGLVANDYLLFGIKGDFQKSAIKLIVRVNEDKPPLHEYEFVNLAEDALETDHNMQAKFFDKIDKMVRPYLQLKTKNAVNGRE